MSDQLDIPEFNPDGLYLSAFGCEFEILPDNFHFNFKMHMYQSDVPLDFNTYQKMLADEEVKKKVSYSFSKEELDPSYFIPALANNLVGHGTYMPEKLMDFRERKCSSFEFSESLENLVISKYLLTLDSDVTPQSIELGNFGLWIASLRIFKKVTVTYQSNFFILYELNAKARVTDSILKGELESILR